MALVILVVVSLALGRWATRGLRFRGLFEALVFRLFAGLALCSVLILVTGSISLRLTQFVMLAAAAAGLAYEVFSETRQEQSFRQQPRDPFALVDWACVLALVGAATLTFLGASAPATGWDACVAHLALPMDYAREGRILFWEGNEYSAYPHLAHVLFAYTFFQGGETSTAWASWLLGMMAWAAAYVLGCRTENRRCGIVAAAVLATSPIFMDQAGTVSVDLAFCAFALAALAALMAWYDERRTGWLLLAAFLAGSSCGIRHTGYLTCLLMALGVLLAAREDRIRAAGWFGGCAFAAALPWLLRSAFLVGNPFFPFFASLLGSGTLPHREVAGLGIHETAADTGLKRLLMFPWDIVMRPHFFDGWTKSPGGLALFLGIPGLFVGGRKARALGAFSLSGIVAFFYFQRLARYVLPFLAPMMIVAGVAASRLKTLRHLVVTVLVLWFGYALVLDLAAVHFKVPVIIGLESRKEFLEDRVERFPAFEWVNEHVPSNETVFTFDRRTFFIKGRTFQNDEPLRRLRDKPIEEQVAWLKANNIKWVFLPVTYIEESSGLRSAFLDMITSWQRHRRYFTLEQALDIPRPRVGGTERVEIYGVRYD